MGSLLFQDKDKRICVLQSISDGYSRISWVARVVLGTALVLGECSFLRLSLLLQQRQAASASSSSSALKPREEEARRNRMSRGRRPLVSPLLRVHSSSSSGDYYFSALCFFFFKKKKLYSSKLSIQRCFRGYTEAIRKRPLLTTTTTRGRVVSSLGRTGWTCWPSGWLYGLVEPSLSRLRRCKSCAALVLQQPQQQQQQLLLVLSFVVVLVHA